MAKGNSPALSSQRHAELVSASITPDRPKFSADGWTLKQVHGDGKEAKSATPQAPSLQRGPELISLIGFDYET